MRNMDESWVSSRRPQETLIGGRWRSSTGDQLIRLVNPSYDEPLGFVRESGVDDVDAAVEAAVLAAPILRAMSVESRIDALERLAEELELRSAALATTISAQMGMPIKQAYALQVTGAISIIADTVSALEEMELSHAIGSSVVSHDPVGVVAAITPWNYPLLQILSKIAPAFAAGCPVVLKPSEITPLDALILAEAVEAAELPPGAFNLVLGTGPHIGERLVRDPRTAMVSLTGSTRAGRRVAEISASRIKRVALELGGKSPSILLQDAPLERAVADAVLSVMVNSGQTCTALTRLIVPLRELPAVEELAVEAASQYLVGPADVPSSDLGPLANANQRQLVDDHIDRALIDGARPVWSYAADRLPSRGTYAAPHIFSVADPTIAVAQEEIFGPVLTIIPYVTEAEAIEIANGTDYGLAASVWSNDQDRATAVARQIQSGSVSINDGQWNGRAPFGGHKQSGLGRELGAHGILEFTEIKSVHFPTNEQE